MAKVSSAVSVTQLESAETIIRLYHICLVKVQFLMQQQGEYKNQATVHCFVLQSARAKSTGSGSRVPGGLEGSLYDLQTRSAMFNHSNNMCPAHENYTSASDDLAACQL